MNRWTDLISTSLLCLLGGTALGGCIIIAGDDDDGPVVRPDASVPPPPDAYIPPPPPAPDAYIPEPGDFYIIWHLQSGPDGEPLEVCPEGSTDIRVTIDPDPEVADDETYELYDCADGYGITGAYEAGVYDVLVELGVFDGDGEVVELHARSDLLVGVELYDDTHPELDFAFSVDHGALTLGWEVYLDGALSDCAALGAAGVAVQSTPVGDVGTLYDTPIECAAGEGVTDPIPLGVYTVAVQLIDGDGFGLGGHDPTTIPEVSLDYGNEYQDLGLVELLVSN